MGVGGGGEVGVQVSMREFHTHIHLDYVIIGFYFRYKKEVKKNK